jgi:hypothetical protein
VILTPQAEKFLKVVKRRTVHREEREELASFELA